MLFSLFEYVLDKHTPEPRQIVLAFSGGMDSRVMLDLLATYRDIHPQHHYLVIHVHHGLSPKADTWLAQCERWAGEADFAFKGIRVSLSLKGESLEKAARDARYQAILNSVDDNALVLTGQHADDQAETFLLALKRGSGPAGLAAMPEIRPMEHAVLCRPLLEANRKTIEEYAESQGLNWVEDESNLDNRFDRNFIRQEWLPKATQRWVGLVKAINRTATHCAEQEQLLDELLVPFDADVISEDATLSINNISNYSAALQTALVRRWLKKVGRVSLSKVQLDQVFSSVINAAQDANPALKISQGEVRRYQGKLWFVTPYHDVSDWGSMVTFDQMVQLPDKLGKLQLVLGKNCGVGIKLRAPMADEPVRVSFDPEGLSAHPEGRQGKRKMKKLFQEYGVPSWLRRRTPILFYGDTVAAVGDLFVCKDYVGDECELVWHKFHALNA
ncbi:tRNA lysidine(34) synthetase TilS [Grimontia marina]|uniref:tRNA(Ile)-lysidine synthase n=1 Tax=Grimontia marina TaxID=646534 RepID=A0A128EVF4_9GAMM|nr:tRNA lysidine(34) synthetase TilS [Grimontia marina]CZF77971.1 tRNA(Ile)-lysidine synthase [Grimontia marina]